MMSRAFEGGSQIIRRGFMMKRLLDRQSSLIHYLTSGAAIFNDGDQRSVDPDLRGIDRRLLRIEARFSFEKRMDKIAAIFSRTFVLLGADRDALLREFVDACPPFTSSRLQNAHQFHDFLSTRWRHEPAVPAHLVDVAACELAFASARILADNVPHDPEKGPVGRPCIRRSPGVVLLRCAHDIRALFENASEAKGPIARESWLAIRSRASGVQPDIFELAPAVFDLLGSLHDWADQAVFDECRDVDKLISELATVGLIESSR
jgi:hypothetical protein